MKYTTVAFIVVCAELQLTGWRRNSVHPSTFRSSKNRHNCCLRIPLERWKCYAIQFKKLLFFSSYSWRFSSQSSSWNLQHPAVSDFTKIPEHNVCMVEQMHCSECLSLYAGCRVDRPSCKLGPRSGVSVWPFVIAMAKLPGEGEEANFIGFVVRWQLV